MAFSLNYTVSISNDNKLLTITDATGEVSSGTASGWEIGGPNPDYTLIGASGSSYTLELDIAITLSDGTETTYDTIDLFTEFAPVGGFASISDLVFELDCSKLLNDGVALGTSDDEFPDGIYNITYTYNKDLTDEVYKQSYEVLYGVVKNKIYDALIALPYNYTAGNYYEKETLDTLFLAGLLDSLVAEASLGYDRRQSILNTLTLMEGLVDNVSTYTW